MSKVASQSQYKFQYKFDRMQLSTYGKSFPGLDCNRKVTKGQIGTQNLHYFESNFEKDRIKDSKNQRKNSSLTNYESILIE